METAIGAPLRFVSEYRHVGAVVTSARTQQREVHERCLAATCTTRALARRILANRKLPRRARTQAAQACVVSRSMRFVGCRERPAARERHKLYAAYMRPFRALMECGRRAKQGSPTSDAAVRKALRIAHPEAHCMADRLRVAACFAKFGACGLHALLQSEGAAQWRRDLMKDLRVFKEVMGDRVSELPCPRSDVEPWERLWCGFPRAWKSLVAQFLEKVAQSEPDFLAACARANIETASSSIAVDDEEWMCLTCFACFSTEGRVAIHRAHAHDVSCALRERVRGSVCPFCGNDYRSRLRLRTHLIRGARSCVEQAMSLPILPLDVCEEEQRKERGEASAARKAGINPLKGPPMRPASADEEQGGSV